MSTLHPRAGGNSAVFAHQARAAQAIVADAEDDGTLTRAQMLLAEVYTALACTEDYALTDALREITYVVRDWMQIIDSGWISQ